MTSTDLAQPAQSAPPSERRTRQRQAISDYLATIPAFLTAQQIHDHLRGAGVDVSLPTVYRTLAHMAESGEVDILTHEGQSSYRRCSTTHHHHLTCRVCGRAVEIADAPIDEWIAALGREHGYTDITHVTELSGLCTRCASLQA
jgi:Fur family ferric uptake transcriptional regulator